MLRELTCQLLKSLQDDAGSNAKAVLALAAPEAVDVACFPQRFFVVNVCENLMVLFKNHLAEVEELRNQSQVKPARHSYARIFRR